MRPDGHRATPALFFPAAARVGEALWQPAADVYRTADGWLVKFDLAGVRPEDIRVSVSGSRLIVQGSRRDLAIEEGCCHYQMEISYSRFEREVTLPDLLDHRRIEAEHRHGMLLIRIHGETEAR